MELPSSAFQASAESRADLQIPSHRWAMILAGGDGKRLLAWTQRLTGDDRPKQFCKLFGDNTLLGSTTQRVARLVPLQRVVTVVTQKHERFYEAEKLAHPGSFLVQPENCGTAPAILSGLLAIQDHDPLARVALFPADHFFANEEALHSAVTAAFFAVRRRPELIVLLGIVPDAPIDDYGWIRPGRAIRRSLRPPLFHVDEFIEKPSASAAAELFAQGCLWSSFLVISSVSALLRLVTRALPDLHCAFTSVCSRVGSQVDSPGEAHFMARLYASLPTLDFSKSVLAPFASALTVLPLRNAGWMDLGGVDRVMALQRALVGRHLMSGPQTDGTDYRLHAAKA